MVMKYFFLLAVLLTIVADSHAQESALNVTPTKCVALRKGQVCYQSLRIRYSSPARGDFCLLISAQQEPLKCWLNIDEIDYRYRFASKNAVEFQLVDLERRQLASAQFQVAWVYKQSRVRNRWRIF